MALPNNDLPTYTIKVPSTNNEIVVRPFTVGEERVLLLALESKDENDIIQATKQIVKQCVVSEDVNVDAVPFFDMDYIFIALRAKSVGPSVETNFSCLNIMDDGIECGTRFPVKIDIVNYAVNKEDVPAEINIGNEILVKMKYPTYAVMKSSGTEDNLSRKIKIIANSIEYIMKAKKVYTTKDFERGEVVKFVENLSQEQFNKLENWINNFPSFSIKANATCPKCKYEHNITFNDFSVFF